jgi:SM-20-related protein
MASEEETRKTSQAGTGAQEPPAAGGATRRTHAPARLIEQLAARGCGIVDDFVGPELLAELRARCLALHAGGALRPARIGRGASERFAPEVRGDFIAWLSEPELDAEQKLLRQLDDLRIALNRDLMTGLEDFQGHFALYPSGAAYARHVDRLAGTDVRAISIVLYLNENWVDGDGGVLRIYTGSGASEDVLPLGARLVAFLSERFEHEVLPAQRERLSFTGWYRRRPLEGFV